MSSLPAIGSTWYVFGHHYQVTEHRPDGTVRLRNAKTGARLKVPVYWHLAGRKAVPSPLEPVR